MNSRLDLGAVFRALSDPTRKAIFEFLFAKRNPVAVEETGDVRPLEGATVGEVCCHITGCARFSSTVSHHIRELRLAGLILAEKQGRFMVCCANREALGELLHYFNSLSEPLQPELAGQGANAR